jgi:hypothetical protein
MKRVGLSLLVALVSVSGVILAITTVSSATHTGAGSRHSDNMRLLANYDDNGTYRNGTDIAFWGDMAVLGTLDQPSGDRTRTGPGGFRLMDISNPVQPREIGQHQCLGDQSDVSIWEDIVVVSVDKPTKSHCTTGQDDWEGVRIVSIADKDNPRILDAEPTDCGSHTNTILPDPANDRLLVYVLSYPLAGRYNPPTALRPCNAAEHRKISVVEVPLSDPSKAKVIGTPNVGTTIGCHDVTLFLERKLAAAACLTETQLWDLSTPEKPKIVGTIREPRMNISHSTAFSNDGKTLVVGDELGGAAASPGCVSNQDTYGGLFFYDVSDPSNPQTRGTYKLPQQDVSEFCTAHLFNVVPRRDDKDVLVSSWYTGATSVLDFTDPSKPTQIAYYIPEETTTPDQQPKEAAAWASYFYNGTIFSNNFDEDVNSISPQSRGLDVFDVKHPLLDRGTVKLSRLNPQVQEPIPGRNR